MTDEKRKEFETVCAAIKAVGGAARAVACFAIAAEAKMSIAKTHDVLTELSKKGFVEVESNGWRYVD